MSCFSARLADRALEQEHLVGKLDRIAVAQVDFELGRSLFMDQRVDLQPLFLREMVDVVDQFVEFVDAGDRITLAAEDRAAGAALRRMQRIVGVVILGDQVEFDLGRDDRLPAAVVIKAHDPLQHVARRIGHFAAVRIDDVADHLRRRVTLPGHDRKRRKIGHQLQVAVARLVAEALRLFRVLAGNRVPVDRGRQRQRGVGGEFRTRHHLAARHAGKVGRDAFDVFDAPGSQPLRRFLPVRNAAQGSGFRGSFRRGGYGSGRLQRRLFWGHDTPVWLILAPS